MLIIDINKVNISGLSNYYDKTTSDNKYYSQTYLDTNYYLKSQVVFLVNSPARLVYAGLIATSGAITKNNGLSTFTVSKPSTGQYIILFDFALATNTFSLCCTLRNAAGGFITSSTQTTSSVTIHTFNVAGALTDTSCSFMVAYT